MSHMIKSAIAGAVVEAKEMRRRERGLIENARKLAGTYGKHHKRHKKDEQKPENGGLIGRALEKYNKAMGREDAKDLSNQDYLSYWNLHRYRKNQVTRGLRAMYLVQAFLAGKPMVVLEHKNYSWPDFRLMLFVLREYNQTRAGDNKNLAEELYNWLRAASKEYGRDIRFRGNGVLEDFGKFMTALDHKK